MSDRIQGEGDYKSARRFNREQQEFVRRKLRRRPQRDAVEDKATLGSDDTTMIRRPRPTAGLKSADNTASNRPDEE